MSIYATDSGIVREPIPAGNYVARCTQMIHIGTVQGQFGPKNTVRIGWELPDELKDFGKGLQPQFISQEYSLSMNVKSNLRKMLESWRGKGFTAEEAKKFDITKLLGVTCMINIIHKPSADGSKVYSNIGSISAMPKGVKAPKQINETQNLSYDDWSNEVFEGLPDFLKAKICLTPEYAEMKKPGSTKHADEFIQHDDDLPF